MLTTLLEWANFLVRWIHLIAGISWIGNSFYFMWMDSAFEPLEKSRDGVDGELYMVHGGHFYHVEKQKIRPGFLPKTLHWFKWEATLTWLSGFVLLILLYYFTNGVYLIDDQSWLRSPGQAVFASLGMLAGAWFLYDLLWQSNFAERFTNYATALSLAAVVVLCWLLCKLFTGRGAYIHLGAIFATLMVVNVWMRILPRQQKMLDDAKSNKTPDYNVSGKAKARSTHNSYLTLPVLFAMLSSHFSLTYGHELNWLWLLLLCVLGGVTRHMMLAWNKGKTGVEYLVPISIILAVLVFFTAPQTPATSATTPSDTQGMIPIRPSFKEVRAIFDHRCVSCHATKPTDSLFVAAPNGVTFESSQEIKKWAARIRERVWIDKTMPLANRSQMTDDERTLVARWVESGASLND